MIDKKKLEELMKNYNLLEFNKHKFGVYCNPILAEKVSFDVSEEECRACVVAFDSLYRFPDEGPRKYELLKEIYATNIPVVKIAEKEGVHRSSVYKWKEEAIDSLYKVYVEEIKMYEKELATN